MNEQQEQEALFWGALLQPVLCRPPDDDRKPCAIIKEISAKQVRFPSGEVKCPSFSSLYKHYRQFDDRGLKGLIRKKRDDCGSSRSIPQDAIERAVELKIDNPRRSARTISTVLQTEFGCTAAVSTLNRHFRIRDLTRHRLSAISKPVRCRWSRDHTHDMWVGDFQDGPRVIANGKVKKSYLSLLIDVHSRFVVSGIYGYRENIDAFAENIIDAWTNHGKSRELYLDNAKVYTSPRIRLACIDLGINLQHRAPKDPAGGGIVERVFKTSQDAFEGEVRLLSCLLTLDDLNRYFQAWLHSHYHTHIHNGTKQVPKERYKSGLRDGLHRIDLKNIREYFYIRIERTVHEEFSDLEIATNYYRVDKKLRTLRVQVRYDPTPPVVKVQVYRLSGEYFCEGILHDRSEGEPGDPLPPKPDYSPVLEAFKENFDKMNVAPSEICPPKSPLKKWAFTTFVEQIGQLKGFQSISQISDDDIRRLKDVYKDIPPISKSQLRHLYSQCSSGEMLELIEQLLLFKEKTA